MSLDATPTLAQVVSALERLFPLSLAEPWDNVGLLIPGPAGPEARCHRVLCAIDLTEEVIDEAASAHADLVVAYHPPMFAPLRRFDATRPTDRVVMRALRAGIAVHSPHTAVDAAPGGVNDWLADAFGSGTRRPVSPSRSAAGGELPPDGAGQGRLVDLQAPMRLDVAVACIKAHLRLPHVRVATSARHRDGAFVASVALCAGAGGKLFESVSQVDLLFTGEMRHHDVLSRVAAGTSVVLCDHTNTERGYLGPLGARLAGAVPGLEVMVSSRDREPLVVC